MVRRSVQEVRMNKCALCMVPPGKVDPGVSSRSSAMRKLRLLRKGRRSLTGAVEHYRPDYPPNLAEASGAALYRGCRYCAVESKQDRIARICDAPCSTGRHESGHRLLGANRRVRVRMQRTLASQRRARLVRLSVRSPSAWTKSTERSYRFSKRTAGGRIRQSVRSSGFPTVRCATGSLASWTKG